MNEHPSTFALDRVRLGAGDEVTTTHLETCERCQAYVRDIATDAPGRPTWVIERTERERKPVLRTRWWLFGVMPAAAMVLILFFDSGPEIREKGGPAVQAFVRDGTTGEVAVWAGAPIKAGDRIGFTVKHARGKEVVVLGNGKELFRGTIQDEKLPLSLLIDAAGDKEIFIVTVAEHPITFVMPKK